MKVLIHMYRIFRFNSKNQITHKLSEKGKMSQIKVVSRNTKKIVILI